MAVRSSSSSRLGTANNRDYNRQSSIGDVNRDGWLDLAIGCDNIGSGQGGEPHSRLFLFQPSGAQLHNGRFNDIGGTERIPDFGGFYNDSKKDRAGPGNDGDLDVFATGPSDVSWSPRVEYVGGRFWRNDGGFRFTEAVGLGEINNTYPHGEAAPC